MRMSWVYFLFLTVCISSVMTWTMKCSRTPSSPQHATTCFKDKQVHARVKAHAVAFVVRSGFE